MRRLALAGLILTGTLFTPFTASAQECALDLTEAIIALTQAQADAAAGDTGAALDAITGVQSDLTAIQESCAGSATAATFDLSETFTEPDMLSFDYPAGWFAGEFHAGLDWELLVSTTNPLLLTVPPSGTITVSSAEITSAYNSPFVALDGVQSASVFVGSPMHLFTELGIYSEDFTRAFLAGNVDTVALLEELQLRIEQSPLSPTVELTSIDAERRTAGIEISADDTSIVMVLVELNRFENRYALLVSPTTAETEANMLALLEAMAATIE